MSHFSLLETTVSTTESIEIFQSSLTVNGFLPGTHRDDEAPKTNRREITKKNKHLDHKLMSSNNFSHYH